MMSAVSGKTPPRYWVLVLLTFFTFFNVGRLRSEPPEKRDQQDGNAALLEVIKPQYETAKDEISKRIDLEHNLFLFQFAMIGAVIGFFFSKIPEVVTLIWKRFSSKLAPPDRSKNKTKPEDESEEVELNRDRANLVAVLGLLATGLLLVDVHLRYNSMHIGELGAWIRDYYEPHLPFNDSDNGPRFVPWEYFLKAHGVHHSTFVFPFWVSFLYLPTILVLALYFRLLVAPLDTDQDALRSAKQVVFEWQFVTIHGLLLCLAAMMHVSPLIPKPDDTVLTGCVSLYAHVVSYVFLWGWSLNSGMGWSSGNGWIGQRFEEVVRHPDDNPA